MKRFLLCLLLGFVLAMSAWAQEPEADDPATANPLDEDAQAVEDVEEIEAVEEEEIDETGLDEQGFDNRDDDFRPTEEIPTDQSIPFPTDI